MLNNLEIIVIALALVVNMLAGAQERVRQNGNLKSLPVLGYCLLILVLTSTGIWTGKLAGGWVMQSNLLISSTLLFIFGIRMLFLTFNKQETGLAEDESNYNAFANISYLATPLAVGFAAGLASNEPLQLWLVTLAIIFIAGLAGIWILQRIQKPISIRIVIMAGLFLIAVAAKMMLELVRHT